MQSLYTFLFIVFAILAILISLIIHEVGHFVFAKLFKVNVKEFSIGVGPKIYSKQFNRTKFSLRCLPIMAYVMIDSKKLVELYSEIVKEDLEGIEKFKLENENKLTPYAFNKKLKKMMDELKKHQEMANVDPSKLMIEDISLWKQLIVYFGGVLFNLIFVGFFTLIIYFGIGKIISAVETQYSVRLNLNPFSQLGAIFENLGKNMVFYNAWKPDGVAGSVGTIVGDGISFNKVNPTSEYLIYTIVNYFNVYNLVLFIINIIPIPPLDGFKIVKGIVTYKNKIKINKKLESIFTYTGIGLIGYIFLTGIIADVIGR